MVKPQSAKNRTEDRQSHISITGALRGLIGRDFVLKYPRFNLMQSKMGKLLTSLSVVIKISVLFHDCDTLLRLTNCNFHSGSSSHGPLGSVPVFVS